MTVMKRWTIAAAVALAAITGASACEDHAKAAECDGKPCSMPCCAAKAAVAKTASGQAAVPATAAPAEAAAAPCGGAKPAIEAKDAQVTPSAAVHANGANATAPCAGKTGCAKKAAAVAKSEQPSVAPVAGNAETDR